jgi:formylglycine-generating enzyme required for sulfatase activity
MKFFSSIILSLILTSVATVSAGKDLPKIAVWDLAAGNINPSYAQDLTNILVSEISKLKKFEVYSQENVRTLAGWTAERMTLGCTDTKCLTALGQMDIAKLISGRVGKIGNRYSVSLNLFDTQNAKAEKSVSEFGRSEDELIDLVQAAVRQLLGLEVSPTKVEPPPSPSSIIEIGRDGRFIAYDNGTVLDTQTNLMWAAKDRGSDINWPKAKSYCENYRGGGYTDWRMPTQEELAGLYDSHKSYKAKGSLYDVHLTELIQLSACCPWASETRGSDAAIFCFDTGERYWIPQLFDASRRALPVRSAKGVEVTTSRVDEKVPEKVPMASTLTKLKDPYTGMEFVFVKGGCYKMGDTFGDGEDDEKPVHEVCVDDFYLGKFEVTQSQWQAVMGNNPSVFKNCGAEGWEGVAPATDKNGGGNCPVEKVSWNDVREFISRLNQRSGKRFRLPTEAEWEYAARSGGKREKWAGTSSQGELGLYAWYEGNSSSRTHPVGGKRPNGLGLYDMSGNVWEWCADWYDRNYYRNSPKDNPMGPGDAEYRVLRGGSWVDKPRYVRAAYRLRNGPADRFNPEGGFRLGLSAR